MAVPKQLTIDISSIDPVRLLQDWQWLPKKGTPVLMTAFGDLFLRDTAGEIYFLDLMCGELKRVASNQSDFEKLTEDREQRRSWFIGHLVTELKKSHGDLPAGKCYSCKVPLTLGGKLEVSNFEPSDIYVHYSVLGQLHHQTKNLSPGTKISDIKFS